jgi:hypothetical protein
MAIYIGDQLVTIGYLGDIPLSDVTQPRSAICAPCTLYRARRDSPSPSQNVQWTSCYDNSVQTRIVASQINDVWFWSSTYPTAPGGNVQIYTVEPANLNPCEVNGVTPVCEQYTIKIENTSDIIMFGYYDCSGSEYKTETYFWPDGDTRVICAQSGSFNTRQGLVQISGSIVPC